MKAAAEVTLRGCGFSTTLESKFSACVVAHTQDQAAGNLRTDNASKREERSASRPAGVPRGRLAGFCRIHRVATATGHTFKLWDQDVSDAIAVALAERMPGVMARMRGMLGDIIITRLRIIRGPSPHGPGTAADYFREAVLHAVWPHLKDTGAAPLRKKRMCRTPPRIDPPFPLQWQFALQRLH